MATPTPNRNAAFCPLLALWEGAATMATGGFIGGRGLREEMLALSCGATHDPLEWPLGLLAVSDFT